MDGPETTEGLGIGVLGPLTVRWNGTPLPLGPDMVRRLLALLALHPARVVSRPEIIAALWGDHPPSSAPSLIHGYASRLRKQLPGGPVLAEHGGYRLGIDPAAVDLTRFTRLATEARRLRRDGAVEAAIQHYARALECWQGPVLADLDPRLRLLPAAVTADQERLAAVLDYARCCDTAGRPAAALGELDAAVAREPLHEGLHARLLIARSAAGDRAGAVDTFLALRRRLADELGLDPGAGLRDAYLRLLREDRTDPGPASGGGTVATADLPEPAGPSAAAACPPRRRPSRAVIVALTAVLTLVSGFAAYTVPRHEPPAASAGGRTFTPQRSGGWVYGPVLGTTGGDDQWFSATVRRLGDHDHLAGARLRFNGDPRAENDNAGVLVAVCATGYEIEAADPDFVHEDTPLPSEGRLLVTLTADNLLTIAFDGRTVVSRRLLGHYRAGRQIIPAAWQLTTGVSMTDIRSNATAEAIAPATDDPAPGARDR